MPPLGQSTDAPPTKAKPNLTVPQILAVVAFAIFVVLAWLAVDTKDPTGNWNLNSVEYDQLRTLTLVLIAALLPSDAIIRYGRSILFSKIDDPEDAAEYAPATTLAQILAMVVFLLVVVAMLVSNELVTESEGKQILDVAQVLIVALLPSDAVIRFGRAMHLSRVPGRATKGQMKRV
jgi:cytochrome bd-type quinol oxidase subunit 2